MPLVQTRGAASAQGFGEFAQAAPAANYIEDVFSTYLYTGSNPPTATQTITNGIDLAGKGGLVWIKSRGAISHYLFDTTRGVLKDLNSASTAAEGFSANSLTSFTSNGFVLGSLDNINNSNFAPPANTFCSWTFREQAKFFDVVTYTGNGSGSGRTISHNLGSAPGMIILKVTNLAGDDWYVYHRSIPTRVLALNSTNITDPAPAQFVFGNGTTVVAPTSTEFTIGSTVNQAYTYVAYLFAHDAGGFGTAGTDNVISCGGLTTDGSGNATVSLGYEPQWILLKTTGVVDSWYIYDTMRGITTIGDGGNAFNAYLRPNSSGAETTTTGGAWSITSTGFRHNGGFANRDWIYMAIRRGPMKTPTSGTQVFSVTTGNFSTPYTVTTGFPVDLCYSTRTGGSARHFNDRLRGGTTTSYRYLATNTADAELTGTSAGIGFQSNTSIIDNDWVTGANAVWWNFRRAPGFFDEVCYTGTGANQNITHNLGVAPELVIVKSRSSNPGAQWVVWNQTLNSSTGYLYLNGTLAGSNFAGVWNGAPTSTYFTLGTNYQNNGSGVTFVAYLFASVAGVSKVGSYTGNGGTQAIACGFTGGARFVLIKRTDSTGDWYIYDTARGMTSGTDPYLFANTSAAQTATLGSVTSTTGGFTVDAAVLAAINTNAASYIFLAIA